MGMFGYGRLQQLPDGSMIDPMQASAIAPPVSAPAPSFVPAPTPAATKPGWGDIGGLRDQLYTLAGHLSAAGGNEAQAQTFLSPVQQQRAEQIAFARQVNQQAQEYQRQLGMAVWKQANPEPTEVQRTHDYLLSVDPTGKMAADYLATKTTAPPIVQHNDDGTLSVYPAGMVPRTTPQPAPAGVTFTPLPASGGAAPQAPSPFRTR